MRALSWFCFVLLGTEISGFACHGPYSGTLGKVLTDHSCKLTQLKTRATRNAVLGLQAAAKDVWSVVGASSARGNQYYGGGNMAEDVCTWRHDVEGTGIELWKGSFGWFDFMNYDGAPVVLCDTWAVCIERPTQVFPSGGSQYSMLRQAATKKTLENYKIKDFLEAGGWSAEVLGDYIRIKNKYSSRQTIILTEDGFTFFGARGTAIRVSQGGQVQEIPAAEALKGLEGLA
uniref:Uncharacterized protein n=1 Tax=Guillardia theta TaxID=55529 RepID=A0A7S4PPI2_GUITH|mmetsp:Transcript_8406/g.28211  ORF Transcript_8406/g.28211 Transcript_8406/m.28211 type:complete len:231 (+) Transcript_8406:245-937(+)